MKTLYVVLTIILTMGCFDRASDNSTSTLPVDGEMSVGDVAEETGESDEMSMEIQGLKSLYMGHRYFRRQADAMEEYAEIAGISGHQTTSIFYGGYKGSAAAIWEDVVPGSQATIQGHLDEGDVQMLG